MAKPWARLEIGYLNHPKFLTLNANAICLWHEGKSYCDTHHTDGLIPRDALKTFRFAGKKSIDMLITPCPTPKPDGTPYAPLWEVHAVGYKMHDYLDHNDCRDAVLARMEQADERREAERQRKAEWRAKKRDKRDVSHGTTRGTGTGHETGQSRSTTETETPTETSTPTNVGVGRSRPSGSGAMSGTLPREHLRHAWCGNFRKCVPDFLHGEFRRALGGDPQVADATLTAFYERTMAGIPDEQPIGEDAPKFWRPRFAAAFPGPAVPAGLPGRMNPVHAWLERKKAEGRP